MDARGIQNALRVQGWPIGVDGNIGPTTRQAVRDFQGAWVASPGRRPLTPRWATGSRHPVGAAMGA